MPRRATQAGTLLLLSLATGGCTMSPLPSDRVETADLIMVIDVETTENGSHVEVSLRLDEGFLTTTPVFLGVGDRLWATVDGEEYELDPAPDAHAPSPTYEVDIPVSRGGAWIQVSLEREVGTSARYSGLSLPADFMIQEPVAGAMRSRGEDALTVRYGGGSQGIVFDPMGRTMTLDVMGDCFAYLSHEDRPDLGWFELAPGTLTGSGTCEGTLALTRTESEGALDPNLGGGSVTARQVRTQQFWSAD